MVGNRRSAYGVLVNDNGVAVDSRGQPLFVRTPNMWARSSHPQRTSCNSEHPLNPTRSQRRLGSRALFLVRLAGHCSSCEFPHCGSSSRRLCRRAHRRDHRAQSFDLVLVGIVVFVGYCDNVAIVVTGIIRLVTA
jgi:hypothetical protein